MTTNNFHNDVINSAVAALNGGGTLLYPTDTIWGIGCDATNTAAVEKIYALKQRDHSKSMLILCEDIAMVERFVGRVGEEVATLLLSSDRPTTVIMPSTLDVLAGNLVAADGTIGVRIPNMLFCQGLLHAFGRPIVSTSANLSGQPSPKCYSDIGADLLRRVDYCVPSSLEVPTDGKGSRILKLVHDEDSSGTNTSHIIVIRP